MTASGCRWPGCTSDQLRPWCDEHFKILPGHIRIMIARREDRAEIEALAVDPGDVRRRPERALECREVGAAGADDSRA